MDKKERISLLIAIVICAIIKALFFNDDWVGFFMMAIAITIGMEIGSRSRKKKV